MNKTELYNKFIDEYNLTNLNSRMLNDENLILSDENLSILFENELFVNYTNLYKHSSYILNNRKKKIKSFFKRYLKESIFFLEKLRDEDFNNYMTLLTMFSIISYNSMTEQMCEDIGIKNMFSGDSYNYIIIKNEDDFYNYKIILSLVDNANKRCSLPITSNIDLIIRVIKSELFNNITFFSNTDDKSIIFENNITLDDFNILNRNKVNMSFRDMLYFINLLKIEDFKRVCGIIDYDVLYKVMADIEGLPLSFEKILYLLESNRISLNRFKIDLSLYKTVSKKSLECLDILLSRYKIKFVELNFSIKPMWLLKYFYDKIIEDNRDIIMQLSSKMPKYFDEKDVKLIGEKFDFDYEHIIKSGHFSNFIWSVNSLYNTLINMNEEEISEYNFKDVVFYQKDEILNYEKFRLIKKTNIHLEWVISNSIIDDDDFIKNMTATDCVFFKYLNIKISDKLKNYCESVINK